MTGGPPLAAFSTSPDRPSSSHGPAPTRLAVVSPGPRLASHSPQI